MLFLYDGAGLAHDELLILPPLFNVSYFIIQLCLYDGVGLTNDKQMIGFCYQNKNSTYTTPYGHPSIVTKATVGILN